VTDRQSDSSALCIVAGIAQALIMSCADIEKTASTTDATPTTFGGGSAFALRKRRIN